MTTLVAAREGILDRDVYDAPPVPLTQEVSEPALISDRELVGAL